ncbi:lipopolysaccharide biosynthesis protein [Shewanella mangrovisoli]|uniref:lipopolysaccharide biosynthesis protein n=1 Tax=Shewanella mangrovisoli TaxID=2864211 RepID=UPI0035B8AA22
MSSIYKNILLLTSASILSRLIGILSIPIITRLYSPSDMGVLSAFISITSVLLAFSTLRYSVVIPLPRTQGYALNASVLCLIVLSFVCTLLFILIYFFYEVFFDFFNLNALIEYWYFLPISLLLFGLVEILNTWAIRYKKFKLISSANVFQSSIGATSKIIFGLVNLNPIGLIIGQVLVQAGSVIMLLKFYFSKYSSKKVSIKRILYIARYYSDIPKFRLPSQVLLALCVNMPILFFSYHFGTEITGQIGLALTVLSLPVSMIAQTIGQAFYGEVANIGRKKPRLIQELSKDIFKKLLIISLVPFTVLVIFGEDIFKIAFGAKWSDAGLYARIMSLYIVTNLVSSPLVNILNIYARNSLYLWINLSRFLLLIGIFSLSFCFEYSIVNTLLIYSLLLSVHYMFITLLIFKVLDFEVIKFDGNVNVQ